MGDDQSNTDLTKKKKGKDSQSRDPFAAQKDPNTLSQALDGDVFDAIDRQMNRTKGKSQKQEY